MRSVSLDSIRVAAVMTDGVEQIEFTNPRNMLIKRGAVVHVVSPSKRIVQAMKGMNLGEHFNVDVPIDEANPDDYDAVLLPGGVFNSERLRTNQAAKNFLIEINDDSKPIAVICHGPWVLLSAGLLLGRKITGCHSIRDDLNNAGAIWIDAPVVVDDNIISSRQPSDLETFNEYFLEALEQRKMAKERSLLIKHKTIVL